MRFRAETGRRHGQSGRGWAVVSLFVLSLLAGVLPLPLDAGPPDGGPVLAALDTAVVERADRLYFRGRADSTVALLSGAADGASPAYPVLWRAARASVARALELGGGRERTDVLQRGMGWGRRAVEARSDAVEGHYWLAAAAGLLAIRAPEGSEVVDLGRVARTHALRTLELDPDHAGAHNVLGRLQFEVVTLPRWKRWVARLLGAGDVVADASWEAAERYMRDAVRLAPEMLYYRLDLARLLAAMDRPEAAAAAAREVLERPVVHPPDPVLKERARSLLRRLEEEGP